MSFTQANQQSHILDANGSLYRTLCSVASVLSVCLFLIYAFFWGSTIFTIVATKTVQAETQQAASRIADLEAKYLADSASLDVSFANASGFGEPSSMQFVARTSSRTARAHATLAMHEF